MADFRPLTTVEFYSSTGVNDENQPYFNAEGTKLAWYRAHNVQVVGQENYSYQRENSNTIRVNGKAENFRKYDMMGFKNEAGKWVLCRINEVNFLNPNCVEIVYAVDYLQTYCENIIFGECWVEREMQANDWNSGVPSFNNLQPEGIEIGERMSTRLWEEFSEVTVYMISALDENAEPNISSSLSNGLVMPTNVINLGTPIQARQRLSTILSKYAEAGKENAIVGVYVVQNFPENESKTVTISYNSIDGYTPVNAKCFSSEFINISLGNRLGEEVVLCPELLTDSTNITINIRNAFLGGCGGANCWVSSYKVGETQGMGVFIPANVQVPWASNGYYNWLSMEGPQLAVQVAGTAIGAAIAGAGGGAAGLTVGAISAQAALSSISKIIDSSIHPRYTSGPPSGNAFPLSNLGTRGFYLSLNTPTKPNLQAIDDYFSRFGYRTNRFKVPNVHTRPKWNFVKTAGANIRGPFPKSAQEAIVKLLDNGLTFWHLSIGENITDSWNPSQNKEGA